LSALFTFYLTPYVHSLDKVSEVNDDTDLQVGMKFDIRVDTRSFLVN